MHGATPLHGVVLS